MNDAWDAFVYVFMNSDQFLPGPTDEIKVVVAGSWSGEQLAALVSQKARDLFTDDAGAKLPSSPTLHFSGVLLRNPVTVCTTDRFFIPPKYREIHQSFVPEFDTAVCSRRGLNACHGVIIFL
jgi:hypothetical protein